MAERKRKKDEMSGEVRARDASRDAWQRVKDRVERATPGDADRDKK